MYLLWVYKNKFSLVVNQFQQNTLLLTLSKILEGGEKGFLIGITNSIIAVF